MDNDILSIRPYWKHAVLEYQIKEIDDSQDMSRSAFTCRAIDAAKHVKDWRPIKEELSLISRLDISVPTSMQAKLDELSIQALDDIVRPQILENLKNDIKILQNQYLLQLVWQNYLNVLKAKALTVGADQKVDTEDITGPDMVKLLVELLLLNRKADVDTIEQMKNILVHWRNNR